MNDRDFLLQLQGYGLMTAEVAYYMPDHPKLIQLFVWQQYDVAPRFPVLHRFLDHWRPDLVLWLESELWPTMLTGWRSRAIPAALINGRLSPGSFRAWSWAPWACGR